MSNLGKSKAERMAQAIDKFNAEAFAQGDESCVKSAWILTEFMEGVTDAQLDALFDCVMTKVTSNDL